MNGRNLQRRKQRRKAVIVILEGLNGTGKSATAAPLAEAFGASILRPFRGRDATVHLGCEDGGRVEQLRSLGVPANTFVDDIYTADFLASTGVDAVLDRSMGSAIAYGLLYKDIPDVQTAQRLLVEWQDILSTVEGKILYVNVTCSRGVRRHRCDSENRWRPTILQEKMLEKWFAHVFRDIWLPKMVFDTSDIEPSRIGEVGFSRVLKQLGE
jgi:hypothetical protein